MNEAKRQETELTDTDNYEGFAPGREHLSLLAVASKKDNSFTMKKKGKEKKLDSALMGLYLSL